MADNPNPNIEERIVAAKFDASDFEKGVNKTIKKLDELNDKLDFKKSGESVTDFAKKTSEAQEKASSSLEKLTDRYTTFIGMLKQKFISGVADQVVNVFFRMEKAALSFAKSMTFDQISAGLEKYESALTSVRMIVNSYKTVKNEITGITEKIHYTQDEAYNAIGNLQAYADETSYSMAQMTDAMSKMVSAGVSLDQAEKNVQGIANACAAAGVNASDAARAFYNLSQAYSSGSLKYTDYRSLQLLNMTNENFEEQLIAAGLKAGTLKEIKDKKGNKMYVTQKSATNKKVTAGKKFTRSQAADYLRYGWADTEVMDYLFGNNFYVDVNDFYAAKDFEKNNPGSSREDYLKNLKDYDKIGSWIEKISDKDNEWKKKYESVKDNATERKKIIDQLIAEADLVTKAATKHGKIKDEDLLKWIDKLEDTDSRKINYKKIKDNQKERKKFLDDLRENDADVKEQVKGANLGLSVEQLEKYILTLDKNHEMRKKYDDMNAAQRKTYLKSLIEEAQALGKIKNKYDEIAVKAFLAAREARNLKDVINAIADYVSSKWTKVFENLIGTLEDASKFFTALSEGGIASLFTDFADWVAEVSDAFNLGGAGSEVFRETILDLDEALGNLLGLFNVLLPESDQFGRTLYVISGEILKAVDAFRNWTAEVYVWFSNPERLERIRGIFANLSGVFAILGKVGTLAFSAIGRTLSALSPVFDAVITALNKITEPIGQLGDKNNTAPFDAIKESLDNLFKILDPLSEKLAPIIVGIGDIFGEVAKFFIGGAIDTAIANIQFFSDAFGLLFELIFGKENSAQAKNGHGVIDGIMKGVEDLSNVCHSAIITVGDFFKNLFADLRTLFGLEPKDGETIAEGGVFANITNFLETNEFIQKAKDWFAKAKVDVQKWFDKAVIDVKAWFESLPGKITKAISNALYEEKDGEIVATPLKVWLDGAAESVGNFIANIPSYIIQGIGKINDIFGYIIDLLFGKKEETDKEKTEAEKLTEQTISDWRKTFISKIIAALKSIPDQVKKLFENTKEKFNKALGTIKKWFKESETGKQIKAFGTEILTGIKNFIISLPENIKKLIQGVGSIGRQVISTIKEIIGIGTIGDEVQDGMEKDIKKISLTGIIDTIIDLGATLANEFLSWFTGVSDIEYNFNWFVSQVVGFIKAIPGKIWDGIVYLGKELSGFWSYVVSQLRHDDTPSGQADKFATDHPVIAGIVENIVEWVEGIPGQLQSAWSNALKGINEFWSGLTGYWTKLDRINEIQNELKNMDYNDPKRYGLEYELNALNNTRTGFEKNNPQIAEFTKMIHGWVTSFTTTLGSSWDAAKITIETFFNTLPDTLTQAWNDAKKSIEGFITEFVVFWNDPKAFETKNGEEDAERTPTEFEEHYPKIAGFVISFRRWLNNIPSSLSAAFNSAVTGVGSFFKSFSVYWTQLNRIQEIQSKLKDSKLSDADRNLLEADLRDLQANPTEFEKQHPFISRIVGSFHGWISDIPAQLSQTWEWAKTEISTFWNEFIDFITHPEKWSTNMPEDSELTPFEEKHEILSGWIISIAEFIKNIPDTLTQAWKTAKEAVTQFFDEFVVFWNDPKAFATEDNKEDAERTPTEFEKHHPKIAGFIVGLRKWLNSIPDSLSAAFNNAITGVGSFFKSFSIYWTQLNRIQEIQSKLKDSKLSDADRNLLEADLRDLQGNPTDFEKQHPFISGIVGSFHGWISDIPTQLSKTWEWAKTEISTFWNEFIDFITHPEKWSTNMPEDSELTPFEKKHEILSGWIISISEFIKNIPTTITSTWKEAKETISTFWDEFWTFISNPDNWSEDKKQDRELTPFEDKYENLANWAAGLARSISNLPETLANSFNESKDKLQKFFAGFSDYWSMETIRKQLEGMADGPEKDALQAEFDRLSGSDIVKNFKKDHPVVSDMVTTLVGWVSEIPIKISETMTSVTTSLNKFWTDLVEAFNGDNLPKEDAAKSESLGERVRDWIINFFANLPTYITDGIHAVLGLVNSGFTGLTDLFKSNTIIDNKNLEKQITDNAEAALEKLDDTTKQVIEETTNVAGETADDIDKNPTPKDNFLQGIVNIGKTFFDIITKTIPGFIVAGFDWIKLNWTKEGGIKDSLLNIFTDVTGIDPKEFHLENLGAKISEALQNLPETIGKGFNKASSWITDIFGIKKQLPKEWAELIKSTSSVPASIKYELKKNWDRLGYDVGDSAEDSSIWSSITNISDSIGEALRTVFFNIVNSDFGTWIITGWNNSLSMFKKVFDSLSKWFSGETDDLGEAVNEIADDSINDEGKSIITSIGETISALITETIPKFIGGAIGKIVSILPDIWKNLWGGITGSFEASAEEVNKDNSKAKTDIEKAGETATESVEQVDDIISTMFDAFKTGAVSNAILVIGGLYLVVKIIKALHGLVSEFTVTGNLAEKAAAKNSIEAVFKRMLAAIIAAMALVVYMSQLNDAQYKRAETTLDKLMSFFEILAGVYAGIQLVKTGGDIVGEVKDAKDTAETLGDTFLGIVKGYGTIKIAETGVEGIGGSISDVISMITGNFTEITGALDIFSKMMPDAIQRIVNAKKNFETALTVIGDVVTLVGKMKEIADKEEDVDAARLVIRKLRLSLGGLAQVFKGDFHADAIYDGLTKIMGLVLSDTMTDFINFVQKDNTFDLFKESIASLGAAISLYDGVNLDSTITENGINNALEILKSILGNDELMGLAKKLTPESFGVSSAEMLETSERVIIFSSAISRIGAAFKDFSGTTTTGLNEFITAVQGLSIDDAFAEGISSGAAGIVSFSEKMTALGDGLSAFGVAIQDFKDEDVTNAGHALDMVAALAERLDETGKSFLGKMFTGGTDLSEFANQIGVLGTGLQTFMTAVHPIEDANGKIVDWDFNNIIVAMYALNEVAKAAKTLGGVAFTEAAADISGLHQLLNIGESTGTTIGTSIAKFVAELSDIPDDKTIDYSAVLQNIEAFSNFTSALYNLKGVNIQEVIDNLTRGYGLKMYDGTARHDWVTVEDNAFLKLINYLFDVYTQITTRMNAVDIKISDVNKGTVTVSLKTKINDVKLFFGIISDVFEAIGDMLTDNTQWRIISARGDTTTSFETKTNDVGVVIESLVEAMSTLQMNTKTLFSAIDALSEYDSDDKIAKAQVIVSILKDLSYIWQLFGSESNTFVGNPLEGIAALNSINTEQAVSGIKKLVSVIDESIKETSVTSDLVESGKSMAVYIIQGIQEAFDSDDDTYKPKVHVVLDDSTVKEQMAGLFGVDNNVDFNISAGFAEAVQQAFGGSETFTSLSTNVGTIKDTIAELKTSVDGLQGELTSVQDAFSGMKIFLYKDELVGYITPDITEEQDRLSEIHIREASQ